MCGRYTLTTDPVELAAGFDLAEAPDLPRRYNVAPSQLVAVVGLKPDGRRRGLVMMKWGFVPRWAKSPAAGPRPINAKAETVAEKAPFRDSFRNRRCLIPVTGFFEWHRPDGETKTPYYFTFAPAPVAFAGVWDTWHGEGEPPLYSCAVITVPSNELVAAVHDRMPAVLTPDQFGPWLDAATPESDLLAMLRPFPGDAMIAVRVGPAVNSPKNDTPDCLQPAA